MSHRFSSQKGQVLLIVVLIMVIALTVGLSLASRSIVNMNNTTEEADSQKAFQAAEAGVELGLQQQMSSVATQIGQKTLSNNAQITNVTITPLVGSNILLDNGNAIAQDNGIDVWLGTYPTFASPWSGNITVYWGSQSGCQDAALEMIVISGTSASDSAATISRYGVDPCSNRTSQNHFSPAGGSGSVNGKSFPFSFSLSGSGAITNGMLMRIIPLYTNTPIGIVSSNSLPLQGRFITAEGSFAQTSRKISFFQTFPQVPIEYFFSLMQPK